MAHGVGWIDEPEGRGRCGQGGREEGKETAEDADSDVRRGM